MYRFENRSYLSCFITFRGTTFFNNWNARRTYMIFKDTRFSVISLVAFSSERYSSFKCRLLLLQVYVGPVWEI